MMSRGAVRPDEVAWAQDMRDRCQTAGAAFWFKQRAGLKPETGDLDDEKPRALPTPSSTERWYP